MTPTVALVAGALGITYVAYQEEVRQQRVQAEARGSAVPSASVLVTPGPVDAAVVDAMREAAP